MLLKLQKLLQGRRLFLYLAAIVTLVFLPLPKILPLLLLIYVISQIIPARKFGFITRIILGGLIFLSINTILGGLFWMISTGLTLTIALLIQVGVVAMLLFTWRNKLTPKLDHKVNREELIGVILACAAGVILMLPLTQGRDSSSLIRILTFSDDNVAHVAMVKMAADHQGYTAGIPAAKANEMVKNLHAYPQGWHLNTYLLQESFDPKGSPELKLRYFLFSYYFIAASWMATLVYLFVILVHRFGRRLGKISKFALGVAATAAIIKVSLTITYPLFTWGAQPQIASLALLLALLLICLETSRNNDFLSRTTVIIGLMLATGVAFTYHFLLPITLPIATVFFVRLFNYRLREIWKNKRFLFITVFFMVCQLLSLVMYFLYFEQSQSKKLNEGGGTLVVNDYYIIGLFVLTTLFFLQKKISGFLWMVVSLCISGFIALGLLIFQSLTGDGPVYYYFKATHTVLILASCAFAVLLASVLTSILRKKSWLPTRVVACLLCVGLLGFAISERHQFFNIYLDKNGYGLSKSVSNEVARAAYESSDPTAFTAVGSCGSYMDLRAMRTVMALTGKSSADQRSIAELQRGLSIGPYNKEPVFSSIKAYAAKDGGKIINVLSSDKGIEHELRKHLGAHQRNVNFIDVTDNRPPATIAECPYMLQDRKVLKNE